MATTDGSGVKQRRSKKEVQRERADRRNRARIEAIRSRSNHDRTLVEFQPDAVEIERRSVPGGARWTLYAVIGLLISTVTWACWAKVDKIVVTNGKLVTIYPPVVVQAASSSPIRSMHFKFGDHVRAGDLLATLDPTFTEADIAALDGKIKFLNANIARLNAERDGREFSLDGREDDIDWINQFQLWLERRNELRARLNEFESRRNKLVVQQENNLENLRFMNENFKDLVKLEQKYLNLAKKGSASEIDTMSRRLQKNQKASEIQTEKSRGLEIIADLNSLAKEESAFKAKWRSENARELLGAQRELDAARQELTKARRMNELVEIRVPEDKGFEHFEVLEVADRGLGSVMQAGEPLYKLTPLNAKLEAEVDIDGKDIALLQEGTEVSLKMNAFPYQQHGVLNGRIRLISEDAFEKEIPGGGTSISYRARIEILEPIMMDNVGKKFKLSPGMTAIAEMKVGDRRVIQYFLYPLIRAWDDSIREP